jgi:glycosyltransferase involved in cell wall biosynthesis
MSSSIKIIIGPGNHDNLIIKTLTDLSIPFYTIRYYPFFEFSFYQSGKKMISKRNLIFDFIVKFLWWLSNKLIFLHAPRFHLYYLYNLFDLLASFYVNKDDIVIGWSQVSYRSLLKVKKGNGLAILEYPMIHIHKWNIIMNNEYENFSIKDKHMLFQKKVCEKMVKEIELADKTIVLSSFAKNSFIENGVPENKISVSSLSVDTNFFTPGNDKNHSKFILLFVGRIEILKGIPYLIEAFKTLNYKDAELWLVGTLTNECKELIADNDPNIKILGFKSGHELREIYQQADLFILPSVQESFGLVILEAMSCGVPVIATENTGGPDIISEGIDGFIVPAAEPNELAIKIHYLMKNQDICKQMGLSARKKIESRYSFTTYKSNFLNTYNISNLL